MDGTKKLLGRIIEGRGEINHEEVIDTLPSFGLSTIHVILDHLIK